MYNFLCVGGDKYGCSLFTDGSNGKIVTVREALESDYNIPLCWAGSHKETLYRHCIENNRKFYNLDTGYFGNTKRKEVIRISVNNLQDQGPITSQPVDRLDMFNINLVNYRRGSSIVIVPPDEKISKVFKLTDSWVDNVIQELKKYTDRPIKIRSRPIARSDRIDADTFNKFIEQDTFVVIGYSSNALVEAVLCGIPVIALGHSATTSLMNYKISDIENISNIDQEKRYSWLKHLSYRQFSHKELKNGIAWKLLASEPSSIRSRA
jgi:hypothetical protein